MKKSTFIVLLLLLYTLCLIKIIILKDGPVIHLGPIRINLGGTHSGPSNLVPFRTITNYLATGRRAFIAVINLVGNVVLFMPVGYLAALVYPKISWLIVALLAITSGFTIEAVQFVFRIGIFDIDDVILNAIGIIAGYQLCRKPVDAPQPV